MKVIRQGIVLWAQFTQDALGVLIDVLEPDWGMPSAVETGARNESTCPEPDWSRDPQPDTARRGTW